MTNTRVRSSIIAEAGSATESISKTSIAVLGAIAALGGAWAFACLAGAIAIAGPVAVIAGFFSALL